MKKSIVMKQLFIWMFLLLNVHSVSAQQYQPFPTCEASWGVARCFYFYGPGMYDKYLFEMDGSDTLYEGEIFKNIYITQHNLPGTTWDSLHAPVYFGGLREENKQIFIFQKWASTDTTTQLVYDFNNTDVGDTIYTNVLSGNPNLVGHVVISTDSVLVGSTYHKRLYLEDETNPWNNEYWIEGIGSSWGLPFATFWTVTDNSYDLSCFYENQVFEYGNPSPTFNMCSAPLPDMTCEPGVAPAQLDFSVINSCQNQTIEFTDLSQISAGTIDSWDWDFGDGGNSTGQSTSHIYSAAGNYLVALTITSSTGCTYEVVQEITIQPNTTDLSVSQVGNTLTANATGVDYQWIDCSTNVILPAENGQTFDAPVEGGSFAVILSNGTCEDTSECVYVSGLGLSPELDLLNVLLYPNPNNGKFSLSIEGEPNVTSIRIYDIQYRVVFEVQNFNENDEIDVSHLKAGYYAVMVTSDAKSKCLKMLIK